MSWPIAPRKFSVRRSETGRDKKNKAVAISLSRVQWVEPISLVAVTPYAVISDGIAEPGIDVFFLLKISFVSHTPGRPVSRNDMSDAHILTDTNTWWWADVKMEPRFIFDKDARLRYLKKMMPPIKQKKKIARSIWNMPPPRRWPDIEDKLNPMDAERYAHIDADVLQSMLCEDRRVCRELPDKLTIWDQEIIKMACGLLEDQKPVKPMRRP